MAVHGDHALKSLWVGLEDGIWLPTGCIELALGEGTRFEFQDFTVETLGLAYAHVDAEMTPCLHLDDDVSHDVRTIGRRDDVGFFHDRGEVPTARMGDHTSRVELAVSALDPAGCQAESPELRLLPGHQEGERPDQLLWRQPYD